MIDVKELQILNQKSCRCGQHEFRLEDIQGIITLDDAHGFYGNLIKYCSHARCPKCGKEVILLLQQKGQTWEIMNTALINDVEETSTETTEIVEELVENVEQTTDEEEEIKEEETEQAEIENNEEIETSNEFICPVCEKVCKNQLGLNAHMRTHQN